MLHGSVPLFREGEMRCDLVDRQVAARAAVKCFTELHRSRPAATVRRVARTAAAGAGWPGSAQGDADAPISPSAGKTPILLRHQEQRGEWTEDAFYSRR